MSIPQPSASFRDVYSLGKEARKTSIIFQSENWFTPFWNHWKMSPLTFYGQNTIWIFTPFCWVRLWASYIFLSPFYWVRYESNYIFTPLYLVRSGYIFLQFLLEQIMDKLHILPLFIGSFCDFHTLWHCVKCSFNTLKKRLIFHTLDYWCLMDKLGLRSWPKYFEQKIRFLHRMEFYLQQRI